jgi:GTP-binding protein HflX
VHVARKSDQHNSGRSNASRLEEAVALTAAIGLEVPDALTAVIARATPATLIGTGKVEEIKERLAELEPEVVIVNATLSPVQQRNLERAWDAKVLDRTALILEIFGERARTREGRLQVELAHLTYQRSRLVRSWTHLERQRGGFGFLGGPGETQIETDRRLIGERISKIRKELEEVKRTRGLHRRARKRVPFPVVALVGYTNAGKSTLFNRLTDSKVLAKDMLFATLDPTMRGVVLPGGRRIILSDTVGFISDLPVQLVAAFRATLEEVLEADLILHVRDAAHDESEAQKDDVIKVLRELGVDEDARPMLEVLNKIDLLDADVAEAMLTRNRARREDAIAVSALSGAGTGDLLATVDNMLGIREQMLRLVLPAEDGAGQAWAHRYGRVVERKDSDTEVSLLIAADPETVDKFTAHFGDRVSFVPANQRRRA